MEDVLDLHADPYDPERPVACFDETSTQLLADTREPLPTAPGRPRREDCEYLRGGTRNLFLTCEPLAVLRQAQEEACGGGGAAHQGGLCPPDAVWLVDEAYPEVPVIRLVLDNLNTHRVASLYETFPPAEARRITEGLEFHHTPKHGSWLNPVLSLPKGLRRSSSACWPGPVSRGETLMRTPCKETSAPACRSATTPELQSTGGSPPSTPEPRCVAYILTLQL